ncbi:MAG: hypothetical protein ABEL76_11640 [Bradymonadaceae bacterium]
MVHTVLHAIDSLLSSLPVWARICVWGSVLGASTMALYGWISDQERIARLKRQSQQLDAYEGDDFEHVWSLAKEAIGSSLRQTWAVFGPTLLAAAPLIVAIVWMEGAYTHRMPAPGETVTTEIAPASAIAGEGADVAWRPAGAVASRSGAVTRVEWPEEGAVELVESGRGRTLVELPLSAPRRRVTKRRWYHAILANPAGYLPPDAPVRAVRFELPRRLVTPWGPDWARTWRLLFLVVLTAGAGATKVGFDIE